MVVEYIIGGGIITACAYMSLRGQRKVHAANERMRQFAEEVRQGENQADIYELSRKYNLVSIPANFSSGISANFDNPGTAGTEKVRVNPDGGIEKFVSDGNRWIPQ